MIAKVLLLLCWLVVASTTRFVSKFDFYEQNGALEKPGVVKKGAR